MTARFPAIKWLSAIGRQNVPMFTIALSADKRYLAVGHADGRISIWNMPVVREKLAAIGLGWE